MPKAKNAKTKSTMKMPPSQTLMTGLHFEAGTPWKITVDSIDVLTAAMGERVVNAFVRCTGAADRLMTITDCMRMNHEDGVDTVRGERTLMTLGMFSVGLVFEFREGLQALHDAGIDKMLSAHGKALWAQLAVFTELHHEDMICEMRNQLAFHIGKDDTVKKGIKRVSKEHRKLVLMSGDSEAAGEARHDFATDVILAGLRILPPGTKKKKGKGTPHSRRPATVEDFVAAIDEAKQSHSKALHLLDEIFVDVLREAGANFERRALAEDAAQ